LQNHNPNFAKFCPRFRAAIAARGPVGEGSQEVVSQNNNPNFVFDLRSVITVRYRDDIK
jgi:hypothetical protein